MTRWQTLPFDDIAIGQQTSWQHTLDEHDIELAALIGSGLPPPRHPNEPHLAPAAGCRPLFSILIGTQLPGPGATIIKESLQTAPAGVIQNGDTLTVSAVVHSKSPDRQLHLNVRCINQHGNELCSGSLLVACPTLPSVVEHDGSLDIALHRYSAFARLSERCRHQPPVTIAVVHPCDFDSLDGPLEAAKRGLIVPVLVGPEQKIRQAATEAGLSLNGIRIESTEHSHAAAARAVEMARNGEVAALMKGSLHTDELMGAVVPSAAGLRTERRISHVYLMDVPTYPKLLLISDAAINITPDLATKRDICQNAIDLAQVLGIAQPKVAILAAVETVNPKMQSTLDAAALCKMADRGQLQGGILDGPLAFDNAISTEAARIKHITSPVSGDADILLVPDLEAGNMLSKQLIYLAAAEAAGIVLGAKVPIVLTSRADSVRTREASIAVMVLLAQAQQAAQNIR